MKPLPFVDVPFVDGICPTLQQRRETVKELSKEFWEVSHLAVEKNGDNFEDYLFQIGFIVEGEVKTCRDTIIDVCRVANPIPEWKEYSECLPEIQAHLNLYCLRINYVPPWGWSEYYKLVDEGKTPRILQGPHKEGNISRRESRMVVYDNSKQFVYGPTMEYLQILKRSNSD